MVLLTFDEIIVSKKKKKLENGTLHNMEQKNDAEDFF